MSRKNMHFCLLAAALTAVLSSGCSAQSPSDAANPPVSITIWNYYNGDQLAAFNTLVDEFNNTLGQEQGIHLESYSQGSITDLESNLLSAAEDKVGAANLPNLFSGYADTAYALDQLGLLVDLRDCLTEEELDAYIGDYLKEGDFSGDGSLKILPTVKSTELLFLNETDWEPFAKATGRTYDDLLTIEGLISTAETYYHWTDAQTEKPDDGRAFFGRDALANYMLVGARQLGCTIFDVQDGHMTVHFDKPVIRRLWDSYYVPFIKGYFSASGRFRSDDIKTGNLLAYAGSSSSSTFFPTEVISSDTESHPIQMKVLPSPKFQDGADVAVQQGAGMAMIKSSDREVNACVTFLKWLTAPEHNIDFSIHSGYLPVTKYASNYEHILETGVNTDDSMQELLKVSLDVVNHNELYTTKAFPDGQQARLDLQYSIADQADQDQAIVRERIEQGMDPEEARAEFLSDDYFETWYQQTLELLKAYED